MRVSYKLGRRAESECELEPESPGVVATSQESESESSNQSSNLESNNNLFFISSSNYFLAYAHMHACSHIGI